MKNQKIKEEYQKKIKLIKEYNKNYYDESNPSVSDHEFDLLKKDVEDLEKKYQLEIQKKRSSKDVHN